MGIEELLPCPSGCGTAGMMVNAADGWNVRYIQCGCGWRSREFVYLEATLAEREAIDAWNARATPKES